MTFYFTIENIFIPKENKYSMNSNCYKKAFILELSYQEEVEKVIIDANMYWFDETLFEDDEQLSKFISEIPKTYGTSGHVKVNDNGAKQIIIEKPTGYQNLNYVQGDYLLKKQLKDMDEGGIDQSILKLPGCHEWMSLDMCKKFNDGMARYAKASKGRCVPLAVIPPIGSTEVYNELKRCRNELKIKGIQLCAHYGNYYLDDEIFADFFSKLNEQKTTVYIHHTPVPVEFNSLYDYNNLRRSYGRCVDQATAIGREIFSGFFDKYPNLTFVHSMLGGGFFAIANMLFPKASKVADQVQRFEVGKNDLEATFKKHIYFEMSHGQPWGKEQLECAIKVLGADHIIFGTSYPVRREWLLEGVNFIKSLNISEIDKEKILYQNAQKIYDIK